MKNLWAAATAMLVLVCAVPASAQNNSTDTATSRNLSLARRVIEITTPDFDKQILAHMSAAVEQLQLDEIDPTVGRWMEKNAGPILLPHLRRLMDEIAAVYANRFTAEELAAMVAFYESPMGASIARKQLAVGIETGEMIDPLMERYASDLFGQLCSQIDCEAANSSGTTGAKSGRR